MNPSTPLAWGVAALMLLSAQAAPTGDSKEQKDIFEINQEAGLLGLACPGFKCDKDCDFGYDTDADGCFVCSCIPEDKEALYQGDMVLDRQGKWRVLHGASGNRGAMEGRHWPRVIPYVIENTVDQHAIAEAIADFHKYTCLRFSRRTNETAYIRFYRGSGCFSPVGYYGYVNGISLARGCWTKGIVIHEIMHSLGFYHEQSRPDRDDYVEIIWDNILIGKGYNFKRQDASLIDSLGTSYDYRSIMHYGSNVFGRGYGKQTIKTKDASKQDMIGQRSGLSDIDIKQLNLRYKCGASGTPTAAPTAEPCQEGNGASYRGTVSVTETGKTCQRWDSQSPHGHSGTPANYPYSGLEENYCRNPSGHTEVWCYTTDPSTRWERCDVPVCGVNRSPHADPAGAPAAGPCEDTYRMCPRLKRHCRDPKYQAKVKFCPKTCGTCGGGEALDAEALCEDKHPTCPKRKRHCGKKRMKKLCPKTCGRCGRAL
ncbi:zinc metalloproteinase nas-7-like [Branchiostoma floridae x Branchiostoma japonicum]